MMSETQQGVDAGSSEVGRGRVTKADKSRRSWTAKEEDILLVALKELVVHGWKADNGLRAGYLSKLDEAMRKEFPDTDLKGMPHINSKLSAWKKNYNSLLGMLEPSGVGVGFNVKGNFMIECTNDQWETIVKKDPNACLMRYKCWPMLDDWKEIFGRDRATGGAAEDVMEAVHEMHMADNLARRGPDGSNPIPVGEETSTNDAEDSVCQGAKSASAVRTGNKKRKTQDELTRVYAFLGEISRNTSKRLEDLATRVGYEFDLGMARQSVFEQLGKISSLNIAKKFDVCEILADKVQRLEIFIGLPDDAKEQYVAHLLQTKKNMD